MPDDQAATQQPKSPMDMSPEERMKMWLALSPDLTEEDFIRRQEEQKARQVNVPQPGSPAPDFEADVLDRDRKRSGETVRLSHLRGKPVALLFGSYT